MSERVLIQHLQSRDDGPVRVSGWVETVRDQKKVQFVILRDESGAVQLVNPATRELGDDADADADAAASAALALTETISDLATGTFLTVHGTLKHDERVKLGGVEIKIGTLEVAAEALPETPIAADSGLDKRMDWRFLDLRQTVPATATCRKARRRFRLHIARLEWETAIGCELSKALRLYIAGSHVRHFRVRLRRTPSYPGSTDARRSL